MLSPEKLSALIPARIKGFTPEEAIGKQMKLGTLVYVIGERNFSAYKKSVKILLFDFKGAPIMYNQAMRRWDNQEILSDSIVVRGLHVTDCSGWESYHRQTSTSQVFLGICDRYFLTITGTNVDLDVLKDILAQIKPEQFPK